MFETVIIVEKNWTKSLQTFEERFFEKKRKPEGRVPSEIIQVLWEKHDFFLKK